MSILGRLPFPAAAGLVAALAIVGIVAGRLLNLGILSLLTLALPVAVMLLYLRDYSRKPLVRPAPAPVAPPAAISEPVVVTSPAPAEPLEPPVHPDDVTLTLFDEPTTGTGPADTYPPLKRSGSGTDQVDEEGRTNKSG
ncbi:MAG: hypothetical protein WCA77_01225 [Thermoplasmata archaeon]